MWMLQAWTYPEFRKNLIKEIYNSGTPTIVVLINGRPLSIRWVAGNIPAILEVWQPGEQGGRAVADILFGDYNPSGRLPVTVPYHAAQLPVYYNCKSSKKQLPVYVCGDQRKGNPQISG